MPETDVAALLRTQDAIAVTPQEAEGLARLLALLNDTVAAGAAVRVTIDSAPSSFETLRAGIAERGEEEA